MLVPKMVQKHLNDYSKVVPAVKLGILETGIDWSQ
jgi:hypothetical protein